MPRVRLNLALKVCVPILISFIPSYLLLWFQQEISMKDLQEAAEEEEKKKNEGTKYPFMYT